MADLRGAPGFGQVDLDIEDEPNVTARPPAPSSSQRAFGEVDLDLGLDPDDPAETPPPPSTSRVFGPGGSAAKPGAAIARSRKPTERTVARSVSLEELERPAPPPRRRVDSVHDESTRVVTGDALSAITRPPPAIEPEDGSTRAWRDIDDAMLANGASGASVGEEAGPPSARGGAPSGTGVAPRDNRVAAMRELYAKGDADGALALAASLGDSIAPGAAGDHPDASIVVEFGEQSIDMLDPFGGLIPMDDELAATATVRPPAGGTGTGTRTAPPAAVILHAPAPSATTVAPAAAVAAVAPGAHLTLTERQSIPRLLKSMAEVSKLKIDHRAGFLLAHVDGMQTLEEILDICAMPSAEALALISTLVDMGVIELD